MIKRCSKCGEEKPHSDFTTQRSSKDGLHAHCQPCRRAAARKKYAEQPPVGLTEGAFKAHRSAARQRGIEFLFTYSEWLAWWQTALAERGEGAERGCGRDQLMMCRFKDQGPYSPDNVYCGTLTENLAQLDREGQSRRIRLGLANGKPRRPRARAIVTRHGAFPSVSAAAKHYGVSRTEIRRRFEAGRL